MEFTLRNFRPQDLETLWKIDQKCFAPGIAYSRLELAAYIRRRGAFTLVALPAKPRSDTQSDGIAGFIVAESSRRGTGHIISIDVLPESRRSGLGSMLLAAAEERLRSIPCANVTLETAVDNLSALAFYKRHNYNIINTIPRYYPNNVNAFVLEKDLAEKAARLG